MADAGPWLARPVLARPVVAGEELVGVAVGGVVSAGVVAREALLTRSPLATCRSRPLGAAGAGGRAIP
jgi:hypothetical protein